MSLKLIAPTGSPRTRKILVAAAYAGVELQQEEFFPRGVSEDALKEFKKKNPNMKVPVLDTPQGPIYESNAILRYIARASKGAKLYGTTKFEEALVDQYLDWATTLFEPTFYAVAYPHFGYSAYDEAGYKTATEKTGTLLKVLNDRLQDNKRVVGSTTTIADIQIVNNLLYWYRFLASEEQRNQFANVTRYVQEVAGEEPFKNITGKFVVAKTPLDVFRGELPVQEETKKAEPKQKAAPAPKAKKEDAPKPKPKAKKDDDDDDDDEPKEKKEKNPLDSLPPSPFNLFDFKTLFVNHPDKKEAFNKFIELFDPEGYSCWRMEYDKAEGEGNVLFLTSNLLTGFMQRLDTFRKYSLGVVGVYGEEPNLEVRGGWVWRGNEIPLEIKEHPSGEWYKFRKLDVKNNAEDRKCLEDYWTTWGEDVDSVEGLRCRDIKYFK